MATTTLQFRWSDRMNSNWSKIEKWEIHLWLKQQTETACAFRSTCLSVHKNSMETHWLDKRIYSKADRPTYIWIHTLACANRRALVFVHTYTDLYTIQLLFPFTISFVRNDQLLTSPAHFMFSYVSFCCFFAVVVVVEYSNVRMLLIFFLLYLLASLLDS